MRTPETHGKIAFIRVEGEAFGGTLGMAGVIHPVSSLLMKATPRPMSKPDVQTGLRAMITRDDSSGPGRA